MSTKRELMVAQQALNEAVRRYLGVTPHIMAAGPEARTLVDAHLAFDVTCRDLAGDRPAAARDTSIAAAKTHVPRARSMRWNILMAVVSQWRMFDTGMTCDELERRLKKSHQTVSPAINYLEERGWLVDTGERRITRLGQPAIVYYPTEIARNEMLAAAWPAEAVE